MAGNSPEALSPEQRAQKFIDWVREWSNPSIEQPLTPEIERAIEQKMNNFDEINRAQIRTALDKLKSSTRVAETPSEISSLFEWTQSDLMKQAPKIANDVMNDTLQLWKWPTLTSEQKDNIKLAIIDRVASWAFAQAMLWGIQNKFNSLKDKFSKIDLKDVSNISQIDDITKEFSIDSLSSGNEKKSENKTMEEKITEQILSMMQDWLGEIQKAHESVPQPEWYTLLLWHPRALAAYKYGDDIPSLLARSGDAIGTKEAFKAEIKQKIQKLEAQIMGMQATKEKVFDSIARLPEMVSGPLFSMMEWLFKIPIFGKFAAAFLGFDDPKTAIDELKMETRQRKAIHLLVSFGLTKNEKWEVVKGDNNGKLGILKDIDFTGVDFAKLKPFMKKMKAEWVDVSNPEFWKSVFVDGKLEVGEWDKKKTLTFPKWEEWKETAETIVSKLNGSTTTVVQTEIPSVEQPANTSVAWNSPAPAVAAAWTTTTWTPRTETTSEAPKTRGTALTAAFIKAEKLPFDFVFDWKTERVSTNNNILEVGSMRWEIKWKWPMNAEVWANSISMDAQTIKLDFPIKWEKTQPKTEFQKNIPALLTYKVNEKNEIQIPDKDNPGKSDVLIITRTA